MQIAKDVIFWACTGVGAAVVIFALFWLLALLAKAAVDRVIDLVVPRGEVVFYLRHRDKIKEAINKDPYLLRRFAAARNRWKEAIR